MEEKKQEKKDNEIYGWIGLLLCIGGAFLIAANISISSWGFILYLISNVIWIIHGLIRKDRPLILKEGIFVLINLFAITQRML
tara:strand:- start:976 stop:1224 length:249 start_codon:yes stop_codon:yes gene_type:complete